MMLARHGRAAPTLKLPQVWRIAPPQRGRRRSAAAAGDDGDGPPASSHHPSTGRSAPMLGICTTGLLALRRLHVPVHWGQVQRPGRNPLPRSDRLLHSLLLERCRDKCVTLKHISVSIIGRPGTQGKCKDWAAHQDLNSPKVVQFLMSYDVLGLGMRNGRIVSFWQLSWC